MKKLSKVMALLLSAALVLSSCSSNGKQTDSSSTDHSSSNSVSNSTADSSEPEVTDPMAKYDEVVTVKLVGTENAAQDYDGYTTDNSPWTEMLLDELNIKVEYMWLSAEYDTKLNLAIASKEIPDIIRTSNYTQFNSLARNEMLADLTDLFDTYLDDHYKEYLSQANPDYYEYGSYDGKLLGVSSSGPGYNNARIVMIREDWMEELNLPAPESIEDVIDIGKAFVDAGKATYALPLNKDIAVTSDMCDIVGVANAFGAYPKIWVEDGNGGIQYGSVQEEMKAALKAYADLYKDGYIDPAFASLDGGKVAEQLTANQIGIVIGAFWLITWPLNSTFEADGVNWRSYPVSGSETLGTGVKEQVKAPTGSMLCVNADYDHPEAMFKILTAVSDRLEDTDEEVQKTFHSYVKDDGNTVNIHMLNPLGAYFNDPRTNLNTNPHVTDAVDNNDESYLISAHDKSTYQKVIDYQAAVEAGTKPATADWMYYTLFYGPNSSYGILNSYMDNDMYLVDALGGYVSPTMDTQWGNLTMLEDQYFVELISGNKDLDAGFDEFVKAWQNAGGTTIVEEVNDF